MAKLRKAAEAIGPLVVGMIQRRTAQGKSWKGGALAQYSGSYKDALAEGRESWKVDLTLTGSYLADIKVLKILERVRDIVVLIGPGTGTSPQVKLANGRAQQTGRRSPPHNVLGTYLERGTSKMPARPHLGITPEERKRVSALLQKLLKG
jgi:hypothetical protein